MAWMDGYSWLWLDLESVYLVVAMIMTSGVYKEYDYMDGGINDVKVLLSETFYNNGELVLVLCIMFYMIIYY